MGRTVFITWFSREGQWKMINILDNCHRKIVYLKIMKIPLEKNI